MSKKPEIETSRLETSLDQDDIPEYKETKLHYYAGLILIVFALLGLLVDFCTSNSLFFAAVEAFRDSQLVEELQPSEATEAPSH